MGFGARLVLGFAFVFSICLTAAPPEKDPNIAADELVEDVSRLQEYIPTLGKPELDSQLKQADDFLQKQNYPGAASLVMKMKYRLVADTFREMTYVNEFRKWKEYGFLPSADALHGLVAVVAHLREEFADPEPSLSALTRFIGLQNLVSAMRLRQESAPYEFNAEVKALSLELLSSLFAWDKIRWSMQDSQAEKIQAFSERLANLNARFAQTKRQESASAAVLVLNQLIKLGPPTEGSVIEYGALPESVQALEDWSRTEPRAPQDWAKFSSSPYTGLFSKDVSQLDSSQQLQILKLELARRAVGPSAEINDQIQKLVQTEEPVRFWEGANELRGRIAAAAPAQKLQPEEVRHNELLAKLAPDALQAKGQMILGAYVLMVDRLIEGFDASSGTLQKWSTRRQKRSLDGLDSVKRSLGQIARKISTLRNPSELEEITASLSMIQLMTGYAVEAALYRSKTSPDYAALLESVARGYNGRGKFITTAHRAELRRLLLIERREGVFRAWVNKDTIATAALSALLVGEAVSVVYSGGASAVAMPATSGAIRALSVAGKTITWISRGILATTSTANLVDRYRVGGFAGLANMESAVDAMMILNVLPRLPMVTPSSKVASSNMGKLFQKMVTVTGEIQFTTGRLLSQLMVAYSGYQFVFAESISEEYQRMGMSVSPTEIRARATLGLATAALVLWKDRAALAKARAENPEAAKIIDESLNTSTVRLSKKFKHMVNPYSAARDFYRVRPSWYRAAGGAAVGLGYAGMDYVFVNEAMMLAHTNPDFNYMYQIEKAHPFPTLEGNESALSMVGISPLDTLLYFGAHADFTHNRERKLYGDRYQVHNYESPEDLVEKLVRYADVHGPIRYLKIMTHGRPGMLYSQMVDLVGADQENAVSTNLKTFIGSGWIDKDWLESKRAWLRARARKAFAPDARIVLWACLAGANFDDPLFGMEPSGPKDIGERFLEAMGDSFLPQGGRIDSSTRILVGLGSVFGSAMREAAYSGKQIDNKYRPVVPLVPLNSAPLEHHPSPEDVGISLPKLSFKQVGPHMFTAGLFASDNGPGPSLDSGPAPAIWDQVKYTAGRAKYLFMYMPEIWWNYGIMLEGPWWHKWYRHLEVPASED